MLVTFGHNKGGVHIEEECAAGWAQLVEGEKKWQMWPPGKKPNQNTQPAYVFTQQAGNVVLTPSGWWHAVETVSNGAVLVGATWEGSLSAITKCAGSLGLAEIQSAMERRNIAVPKLPTKDNCVRQILSFLEAEKKNIKVQTPVDDEV